MIQTGENPSTYKELFQGQIFPTTYPTCTDLEFNPGLGGERPALNCLSNDNHICSCHCAMQNWPTAGKRCCSIPARREFRNEHRVHYDKSSAEVKRILKIEAAYSIETSVSKLKRLYFQAEG
jgi:hypothetical protein